MKLTDAQIKHMVNRFLGWRLPEDFRPDAGISFKAEFNEHTAHPMKHEPSGTNLLDATQAEVMVRHMVEAMPEGLVVFVCSNPQCLAVHTIDPQGHCPKCIMPSGGGFSTIPREIEIAPQS